MKKICLLLAVGLAFTVSAHAGQERGGGTKVALSFVELAGYAAQGIEDSIRRKEGVFDGFNLPAFKAAMISTDVKSASDLCSNQVDPITGAVQLKCLDGEYLPDLHEIDVSEKSWQSMVCLQKMGLVLHEFGRASGNEGGNYRFSSKVRSSQALSDQCVRHGIDILDPPQNSLGRRNGTYKVLLQSHGTWPDIEIEPGTNNGQATVSLIGSGGAFVGMLFDCSEVKCIGKSFEYSDSTYGACLTGYTLFFLKDGNMAVAAEKMCRRGNYDVTTGAKYRFDH